MNQHCQHCQTPGEHILTAAGRLCAACIDRMNRFHSGNGWGR